MLTDKFKLQWETFIVLMSGGPEYIYSKKNRWHRRGESIGMCASLYNLIQLHNYILT